MKPERATAVFWSPAQTLVKYSFNYYSFATFDKYIGNLNKYSFRGLSRHNCLVSEKGVTGSNPILVTR